jgi:RNA polymerase sigma factor (TIGR02999 family)
MPLPDEPTRQELTRLMRAWQGGDAQARSRLFDLVYDRVRAIAAQSIRRQGGATLTPTELAHESLLRLLDADAGWADRRHFFHVVAQATRQVLVDHARRRLAGKRGSGAEAVTLSEADALATDDPDARLLRVSEALEALAAQDARRAQIIELTYFGGFSREEIAAALEVSVGTVDRDLRFGRAWLKVELGA